MKKKTSFLLLSIIYMLAACNLPKAATPSPTLSAVLSEVKGKVDAKQAGEESFTPTSADTVLKVNGQIQTGDDGRVRLDLTSGTIIRVAPSSLFTLTSNDEAEGGLATKIKLELGKIFIILSGGTADVETPSGIASVRGSYMRVEVDLVSLNVTITCLEGDCSAENPAGKVNFTRGEKATLIQKDLTTGKWALPNIEPMTPQEFQEWLDANPEAQGLFNQAVATMTALAEQTPTPIPSPTLVSGVPAAGASNTCFNVIQPVAGSILPAQGKVKFEWEAQPSAQKYIVAFYDGRNNIAGFETTDTNIEKYVEGFIPNAGEYGWTITAYGADENAICSTTEITISKPESFFIPPTKARETKPAPTEPPVCDPCNANGNCYNPDVCVKP